MIHRKRREEDVIVGNSFVDRVEEVQRELQLAAVQRRPRLRVQLLRRVVFVEALAVDRRRDEQRG